MKSRVSERMRCEGDVEKEREVRVTEREKE